jgi:hypothetical protein
MHSIRISIWILISLAVAFGSQLVAQETRGTIFGSVRDQQSSVIVDAKVTVRNEEVNVSTQLVSNETGYYEAGLLLPGTYSVTVESPGFNTFIQSGILITVGARRRVDVSLDLGAVTESILVTADASLLETDAASASSTIDNRSLMSIPVQGNLPVLLAKLVPGVQTRGKNGYQNQGYLVGTSDYTTPGRVGGNQWAIDGAPTQGRTQRQAYIPFPDTIQEIKIETTNFDASSGSTTGITINMMTKGGTNQVHGTLTWQHAQNRWNGAGFFVKQQYYRDIANAEAAGDTQLANELRSQHVQDSGRFNNFGTTIGGPVVKNKLFGFFSYAGTRDRIPDETSTTQPTLQDRAGDFSHLLNVRDPGRFVIHDPFSVRADPSRATHFIRTPFPNNQIPASRMINPVYNSYVGFLPVPNRNPSDPRDAPLENHLAVAPQKIDYNAYTNRVDYNLSSKHRFFGRWNWSKFFESENDWTNQTVPGLAVGDLGRRNFGGTIDWSYVHSPATLFNVSVSANDFREANEARVASTFKPSDVGLPGYLDEKAGDHAILPQMNPAGYARNGSIVGRVAPAFRHFLTKGLKVSVSHIRGNHSIRAGMEMRQYFQTAAISAGRAACETCATGGNTSGIFGFDNSFTRRNDDDFTPAADIGHSWAAFMMGLPSNWQIDTSDSYATHNPYYGWYVQDSWRATPKLTLGLGLRLEYEGGPTERFDRQITYFDPTANLVISDGAGAAYAANPLAELSPSSFGVAGGPVFAGLNGVERSRWEGELMWSPRFSAAYQIAPKTVFRAGYGIFYPSVNVFDTNPDQAGFTRVTQRNLTDDFGVNFLVGDPANGISPLEDPFPVRSDGTRFDAPVREALGPMTTVGEGLSFEPFNLQHARVQQWRIGVQREVTPNLLVEVTYAGSWGSRLRVPQKLDALPEQYWASGMARNNEIASDLNSNVPNPFHIDNFASLETSDPLVYQQISTLPFFRSPTIRKNQLLRPFPHMKQLRLASVNDGLLRTHALEINVKKRFSQGFSFQFGYAATHAKSKDLVLDEFARPSEFTPYQLGTSDGFRGARPHRLVGLAVWELPFGKGRARLNSGILSHLFGGWQIALTGEWQPGPLLQFNNLFYNGDLGGIALSGSERMLNRWFNTDNFERVSSQTPAAFHRRVFPRTVPGVRADGTHQWNGNLMRRFSLGERAAFEVRLDAINIQNRSQMNPPTMNPRSSNFGRITRQAFATNRLLQIQGRISF